MVIVQHVAGPDRRHLELPILAALRPEQVRLLSSRRVFVFESPPPALARALDDAEVDRRTLSIELRQDEIAEALSITTGAVKAHVFQAKSRLRELLAD